MCLTILWGWRFKGLNLYMSLILLIFLNDEDILSIFASSTIVNLENIK